MEKFLLALAFVGLLSGCTTKLATQHLSANVSGHGQDTYFLPRQRINVTLTYSLLSCGQRYAEGPAIGGGTEFTWRSTPDGLRIRKTAAISIANEADPNAHFAIDAEELSARTKTTELKLTTYDNGTIKSVGATIDDRAAEIISATVETGVKIARTVLTGTASENNECRDRIRQRVADRNKLLADLRDPEQYTDEHERAAAVDALARLNQGLSFERRFSFAPDLQAPQDLATSPDVGPTYFRHHDSALMTIFDTRWLARRATTDGRKLDGFANTAVCVQAQPGFGEPLPDQPAYCKESLHVTASPPSKAAGDKLAFRSPLPVNIRVCAETCGDGGSVLKATSTQIAQLGPWEYVTLISKAFQDRSIEVAFSAAGQRTSVTRGASADLEAIASALSSAAGGAQQITEAVTSSIASETQAAEAEAARYKAQADAIEQRMRLEALQAADTNSNEGEGQN